MNVLLLTCFLSMVYFFNNVSLIRILLRHSAQGFPQGPRARRVMLFANFR